MNHVDDNFYGDANERLIPVGRALLAAGIILTVARGLKLTTTIPGLPSFWYMNQPAWLAIGFGLTGLGSWMLWFNTNHGTQTWRPSVPGRRFDTALLYVGEGCHLCHDAATILAQYRKWLPPVQEINIRTDASLTERYCECIPVVVLDGKVRFRGKINEVLLRRLIEGTAPVQTI